jgi:capsular polysaccharide export protein
MGERMQQVIYGLGFSWRKRALVRNFLSGYRVQFVRRVAQVPAGATVALWASGPHRDVDWAAQAATPLWLEDGFLRSVGLGADLVRPLSWVVDSRGMYYDATRPSDLEHLLQTTHFDASTLARAQALRQALVRSGLTKYNVGQLPWQRPGTVAQRGQAVVLVPGQVETDASLRKGAPGIHTNMGLLQAARAAHPDAWLVYKPHPDVVAGLRGQGANEASAQQWCDEVVLDAPMGSMLEAVDHVHVMTSLAGFEALLRGKPVTCHGLPFYAGWGLTQDALPAPRRSRRLDLDALVAGALVLYPRYASLATGAPCTVEQAMAELLAWRARSKPALPWWRKWLRPLIRHS